MIACPRRPCRMLNLNFVCCRFIFILERATIEHDIFIRLSNTRPKPPSCRRRQFCHRLWYIR
jgi:hypothetical protein